jgi:hypothetical protein
MWLRYSEELRSSLTIEERRMLIEVRIDSSYTGEGGGGGGSEDLEMDRARETDGGLVQLEGHHNDLVDIFRCW